VEHGMDQHGVGLFRNGADMAFGDAILVM